MDPVKLRRLIEEHEGRRATAYDDSRGIPTIGVGFNLRRADAREKIQALGLDYNAVCGGGVALTEGQIDALLDSDIAVAVNGARRCVTNFDMLPTSAQMVVVDMVFNLGAAGFGKFKRMIAALEREDWSAAALEMQHSAWYHQVGGRAAEDVARMRESGASGAPSAEDVRLA